MTALRSALPLLLVGLLACSGRGGPAYEVPISMDDLTTTQVRNLNGYAVHVYLIQPGMRHRLGAVESMSSAVFMVPPRLMNGRLEYRLLADPLGPHPTYLSETFLLRPGQAADWRIHEESRASLVAVR